MEKMHFVVFFLKSNTTVFSCWTFKYIRDSAMVKKHILNSIFLIIPLFPVSYRKHLTSSFCLTTLVTQALPSVSQALLPLLFPRLSVQQSHTRTRLHVTESAHARTQIPAWK